MSSSASAHTAISAKPPGIPAADISRAVKNQFGLVGEYAPLVSERDQNFRLRVADGRDYVAKVTSSVEPASVSEFQVEALLHLQRASGVQVPRVVRTLEGQSLGHIEHDGITHKLRIVSYLDGVPLASVKIDRSTAHDFGTKLAQLDIGLDGFSHTGERPVLLWDLQRAVELRELLDHIDDEAVRGAAKCAIDDFEESVAPGLHSLRSQVIHGDANPENVLLDRRSHRISGFIDFGDMVRAPLIVEVAIAAAYLRCDGNDALEWIAPFVAAYQSAKPLQDDELAVLFDLVRARLATTITLLYWRLGARDEDDPYRQKTLRSESGAIRFLDALDRLGRARFLQRLRQEPREPVI